MSFTYHFERTVVISLPERGDRRARLAANLRQCGLAEHGDILWQDAVNGRRARIPSWWTQGPGAWGCRASHLNVLEQARRDGRESVLILEDDAHFHWRAGGWLAMIMPLLPDDWDFFFLGGQHMAPPKPCADPRLLQGTAITRTHAYAVHRRAFDSVIQQVSDLALYEANPRWHIDHQLGQGMHAGLWKAYAPAWWLAAQEEGDSNIARQAFTRRWWPEGKHYWHLPFVSTEGTSPCEDWVYHPETAAASIPTDRISKAIWLRDIAQEAWLQGRLPSCPLSPEEIVRLWPGGHRSPRSLTELGELADYPANQLFPHAFATISTPYQQPEPHNQP